MFAPATRVSPLNQAPLNPDGAYVVYWMTAARRTTFNFGLEHAAAWARQLGKGLVALEALRLDYPHASPRLHAFVCQGMADNARALHGRPLLYHPYLEPQAGAGKGLLPAWAAKACLVVCDWYPCFFLPRMLAAAGRNLPVRLEAVDSCGLLPLAAAPKVFSRAFDFRRWLQKNLPGRLAEAPLADPLAGDLPAPPALPRELARRWPAATERDLASGAAWAKLPLPAGPPAAGGRRGGPQAALAAWRGFLRGGLAEYAERRNQPQSGATSGLSPYLHFGHISVHQVFEELAAREAWAPGALSPESKGQREGWWGMSASAEAFLDQLVTWRELGYNYCQGRSDYDRYESLPAWARSTLEAHAGDRRPYVYGPEELERAASHDEIWNAAQRQLREEGVMAGYLRMLWGKKILEWSPTPKQAVETMIRLNDRYALDGRDPNSYAGIFWCLGRYDRAFGPERPVFGKVRYMSSASTRRKLRLAEYLARFAAGA